MKTYKEPRLDIESVLFHQVSPLGVIRPSLKEALLTVNRLQFLPAASRSLAYADAPIVLKRRCELPFFVLALLLEAFDIPANAKEKGLKATVVSAGSGYSATLLSRLCHVVEAFEPDSILFARLIDSTRYNTDIIPVTTLSKNLNHYILLDGSAYETIPQYYVDALHVGGKIAVAQTCMGEPTHQDSLRYPLCSAVIYTKVNEDSLDVSPIHVKSLHLPVMQSALFTGVIQKESFKF